MTAALAVVSAIVLVPGIGAALALLPPGVVAIETRLALSFGLGYALAAGLATLLALLHALSLPTFVTGLVVVSAFVWVAALRGSSLRAHARALRAQAREAPYPLAAGLVLLAAVALTRPLHPPEMSLSTASAWRYWADGLEVAAAGRVPAETMQWGTEIPTTVGKVAFNAFQGGLSLVLGPEPLPPMQGILSVTAVGLTAALLALGRELGLGVFSPLVPALTIAVPAWLLVPPELTLDLETYRTENVGRMVAFCALVAGIAFLRTRAEPARAAVVGALLAVAGLTHLVPALVAGGMLALYAVARVVADRGRRRRVVAGGGVAVAVFAGCYLGAISLAGGESGFEGATNRTVFERLPADVDPTRSFVRAKLVRPEPESGGFLIPPRALLRTFAVEGARLRTVRVGVLAGALVLLALATVAMVMLERSLAPLATVAWGTSAMLVVVAFVFSRRYATAIPANFGPRRLYDYAPLLPALIVPGMLAAVAGPLVRGRALVRAALAAGVAAFAVAGVLDGVPEDRSLPQAEAGLAAIEGVAEVVPCGARMLTNVRTAGTWEALTGRRSILEGMAPYLRPDVMAHVLPLLVQARQFFRRPGAHGAFLDRQRVEYLVMVNRGLWIGTPGGLIANEGSVAAVAALRNVRPLHRDGRVAVFSVGPSGSLQDGRQPRRCEL